MIRLDLQEAEPDVQQMMDASQADHEATDAQLTVLMWGVKVFSREDEGQYDPSLWRTRLEEARSLEASVTEEDTHALGRGGPEHVASVCIRDHFDEMTQEEQTWCVETVCQAIESEADNWNDMARRQRYPMAGDRPSAYAVSCLMVKSLPNGLDMRLRNAFACAVLHPTDEVRQYAVAGVGRHLWTDAPALAMRCVNVLASEAQRVQELWRIETERQYSERSSYGVVEATVGRQMCRDFYGDVDAHAYEQLDIRDWTGSEANSRILTVLAQAPTQELAIRGFQRLAAVMVEWWDEERDREHRNRRERSIDVQIALPRLLEEFVLKVDPQQGQHVLDPILNAVDRHPKESSEIIQGIVGAEDRLQRTDQFWYLWGLFAGRVKAASWLAHLDAEHPSGGPVLSAIFLTQYWKDDVRHWRSLEGCDSHVTGLFETLPPTALVLDSFVRFLYHVGEHSLPVAFRYIGERLRVGNAQAMLRMSNTVFMLETLLRRFVYGRPLQLKTDSVLRDAVLYLLDVLVECGSSSAYRMRDDFVTPAH
ncbi:hypothetical protein ACFL5Q_07615 [Planctomycetota bacterium]